jgi:tRNA modification GTPase
VSSTSNTTIVALSSPPGAGPRGVLRVSGPRARELVQATWRGPDHAPDLARRGLHRGRFRDGRGEQPALLLWMPAPHSFTREDVAELHLPGAAPLLAAALERLLGLGAVLAAPGEFTRRAFLSGRIDLTRAEGVLTLVAARNEEERRSSSALLFGGLARRVAEVREALEDLRALCEATLDFEESDTGHIPAQELERRGRDIAASLERAVSFEAERAPRASGLPCIALHGARNAGKSALFNALAGSERALVSDRAGTTRDALAVEIDLSGSQATLCDTAGLDPAARGPDAEAQAAAQAARSSADLVLWVVDAVRRDVAAIEAERRALPRGAPYLLVWSKIDRLGARGQSGPPAGRELAATDAVATSALAGLGIESLRARMALALQGSDATGARSRGAGRELALRHRLALERCAAELESGFRGVERGQPLELLAEHLRAATAALDEITGETTSEAILDRLFARFCLGK